MEELSCQKATLGDYDDFYKIKCDSENVKWSGFASVPDYERLKEWYIHQIGSEKRTIYLAYWNGAICGFFYLDKLADQNAEEIGYGVLTDHSGKGIGTALVGTGVKLCKSNNIIAWVSEKNRASERCFEKNGFVRIDTKENRFMSAFNETHVFYCWTKVIR